MAYTVGTAVEAANGGTTQTIVDSPNFTAVTGDCLLAIVRYYQSTTTAFTLSDTVGTNDTWSELGSGYHPGSYASAFHAYTCTSVTGGSCTVRADSGGNTTDYPAIVVVAFTGLNSNPLDQIIWNSQTAPGSGTDAVTSGNSATLATQPSAVIGFCHQTNDTSVAAVGTGFTNIIGTGWVSGGNQHLRVEHQRVTSTSALAATFTAPAGTDVHRTSIIILKEASGAGTAKKMLLLGAG